MSNDKAEATYYPMESGWVPEERKEIHPDWLQHRSDTTKLRRNLGITVVAVVGAFCLTAAILLGVMGSRISNCHKAIQTADSIIALDNDSLRIAADAFGALGDLDFSHMATLRTELAQNVDRVQQLRSDYTAEKEACQ